jgi:hypothetical protein
MSSVRHYTMPGINNNGAYNFLFAVCFITAKRKKTEAKCGEQEKDNGSFDHGFSNIKTVESSQFIGGTV